MGTPLISVIVPVYKVEAYLDRCVQSIVDQTYRNLEIILVDDGSPDNCPAMCDTWAAKDSRIKVIHKSNGGGAQARNFGLDKAQGQYVGFVDSDDFILPDMYWSLMDIIMQSGSDIAECGFYTVLSDSVDTTDVLKEHVTYYSTEQALRENIRDCVCRQLVWNKLYARRTLESVRFVEGQFIDDEFFTYKVLGNAEKVAVTEQKFYCYRQQQSSAMHQVYSLKWLAAVEARQCRMEYVKKSYQELLPEATMSLLYTCMYHGQLAIKHLNKSECNQAFEYLTSIVRKCPIPSGTEFRIKRFTHKCWLVLAKCNFELCCKIRNLLGVGL